MVVGFIGIEHIMGLMGIEYVVVHVMVSVDGLAKSTYPLKTEPLQTPTSTRLWSTSVRNDMLDVIRLRANGIECSSPNARYRCVRGWA